MMEKLDFPHPNEDETNALLIFFLKEEIFKPDELWPTENDLVVFLQKDKYLKGYPKVLLTILHWFESKEKFPYCTIIKQYIDKIHGDSTTSTTGL